MTTSPRYLSCLTAMRSWPAGWNRYGALPPKPEAIAQAEAWLPQLQSCVEKWHEPNVTASGIGEVALEWWHGKKKHLTLYLDGETIEYLKSWGNNINTEMMDGEIGSMEEMGALWAWLWEEEGEGV